MQVSAFGYASGRLLVQRFSRPFLRRVAEREGLATRDYRIPAFLNLNDFIIQSENWLPLSYNFLDEQKLTCKRAFEIAQSQESAANSVVALQGSTTVHEVQKFK